MENVVSLPDSVLMRIMAYAIDLTLDVGLENEENEEEIIDVRHVLGLRMVCKSFLEGFEKEQVLVRLKAALERERAWKNKLQAHYLYNQLAHERRVLTFRSELEAFEYPFHVQEKINTLGLRLDSIDWLLRRGVMKRLPTTMNAP